MWPGSRGKSPADCPILHQVLGVIFFSGGVLIYAIIILITVPHLVLIREALTTRNPLPTQDDPTVWYTPYISKALSPGVDTWKDTVRRYEIATVGVCALELIVQILMVPGVFREVGWKIFRKIGADRSMQKRYTAYAVLVLQIKLSLFFTVGSAFYFLSHGIRIDEASTPTFLIASAVGYVFHAVGLLVLWWSVYTERLFGLLIFAILTMAYEGILANQLSE
ncbi:hypothetical protein HDU93_009574, partial [Gonapodya sp. JEL0774]